MLVAEGSERNKEDLGKEIKELYLGGASGARVGSASVQSP